MLFNSIIVISRTINCTQLVILLDKWHLQIAKLPSAHFSPSFISQTSLTSDLKKPTGNKTWMQTGYQSYRIGAHLFSGLKGRIFRWSAPHFYHEHSSFDLVFMIIYICVCTSADSFENSLHDFLG